MKRSAPLKPGRGFARAVPAPRPAKQVDYVPRPRAVAVAMPGPARASVPVPKENALQHAGYMAAVRTLPCARCGIAGFTQFCHADEGKGKAIKTDCRRGWPGCGPRPMVEGCHEFVGRRMTRTERRAFETAAATTTRAQITRLGLWPKTLPPLKDDTCTDD